jgi:hypothetical protein
MKKTILFFCILFFSLHMTTADELELSNGDTISGIIISIDENDIVIETEYGTLTIKRRFVTRGTFTGNGEDMSSSDDHMTTDPALPGLPDNIPVKGLVCELLFDSTLTGVRGTDYTIKNVNNVPFCKGIDGIEDHAISADGSGMYLVLENHRELDAATSLSVSFWVFVENWEKTQYILSKWSSTEGEKAEGKFAIQTKQGFILCYIVEPSGTYHYIHTEKPIKLHEWNHIVITFHNGQTRMYMNNQLTGEKTFGFTSLKEDSSPLFILTAKSVKGNKYAYYNLTGMLDNVRIYNRPLTDDEIAALYSEKKE